MIACRAMNSTNAFRIAAAMGFLGVALGAFGAHGLKHVLETNNAVDIWKTASNYHLIHAVVLLFLAARAPFRAGPWILFLAGIVVFSGSLYLFSITGIKGYAMVTPVGGTCFLAGWLWLAVKTGAEAHPSV